jgi:glycosyltransferase involved in cell wall biosynthesis
MIVLSRQLFEKAGQMVQDKTNRKPCVLISHQGCIPIYRKSFFERLNALGRFDYVVVHGSAPRGTNYILAAPPFNFPTVAITNYELPLAGRSIIWQPVVWRVVRGDFDAAVIGAETKFISNLVIALAMLLRRRPVLTWGFGFHQYVEPPKTFLDKLIAAAAGAAKMPVYRMMSGFLVYTEGGKRVLENLPRAPKRIAVLRNTIDLEREAGFQAAVETEPLGQVLQELGVRENSVKFLYFGRLVKMKCIDVLVEYAKRCALRKRDVDVMIFGAGPEELELRAKASGLRNVVFHKHHDLKLARALRVSAAVIIPGYVGLAIPHGFAHGVPILTRKGQLHSPEIEYIEDGVNGLILPEDLEEFFAAIDFFVDNEPLRKRLADGAKRTAANLGMENMVNAFHNLVADCLRFEDKGQKSLSSSGIASGIEERHGRE